jgi:hypothetical protein
MGHAAEHGKFPSAAYYRGGYDLNVPFVTAVENIIQSLGQLNMYHNDLYN